LGKTEYIEDQGHLAVAENSGSRENGDALQLFAQRFDDDFFGIVNPFHDETKLPAVCLEHDNVYGQTRRRCLQVGQ
jgi:hypothetical protein